MLVSITMLCKIDADGKLSSLEAFPYLYTRPQREVSRCG